jgi:hypothetical protein
VKYPTRVTPSSHHTLWILYARHTNEALLIHGRLNTCRTHDNIQSIHRLEKLLHMITGQSQTRSTRSWPDVKVLQLFEYLRCSFGRFGVQIQGVESKMQEIITGFMQISNRVIPFALRLNAALFTQHVMNPRKFWSIASSIHDQLHTLESRYSIHSNPQSLRSIHS